MFWLPNFFAAKQKAAKPTPASAKPKPKEKPASAVPFWVGTVMDQGLKDFIMVNAHQGKQKEALEELLDYTFLETCKQLNRRP